MKRTTGVLLSLALLVSLMAGCASKAPAEPEKSVFEYDVGQGAIQLSEGR